MRVDNRHQGWTSEQKKARQSAFAFLSPSGFDSQAFGLRWRLLPDLLEQKLRSRGQRRTRLTDLSLGPDRALPSSSIAMVIYRKTCLRLSLASVFFGMQLALSSHANQADLTLSNGWNLVSLPLQPNDTNILSVLTPIQGEYQSVWTYSNGHW